MQTTSDYLTFTCDTGSESSIQAFLADFEKIGGLELVRRHGLTMIRNTTVTLRHASKDENNPGH